MGEAATKTIKTTHAETIRNTSKNLTTFFGKSKTSEHPKSQNGIKSLLAILSVTVYALFELFLCFYYEFITHQVFLLKC